MDITTQLIAKASAELEDEVLAELEVEDPQEGFGDNPQEEDDECTESKD